MIRAAWWTIIARFQSLFTGSRHAVIPLPRDGWLMISYERGREVRRTLVP